MRTGYLIFIAFVLNGRADASQQCASCSSMVDQVSCQHFVICEDYEKCFLRKYRTESGSNLVDQGCMTSTECPHTVSAIVGKRDEGHHVSCLACCNNASLCNKDLACEAAQNQGTTYPRDCSELNLPENVNDTYIIFPYGVRHKPVSVYCIFDYENIAWTVIQRRFDGSVDFYRNWGSYVAGFGSTNAEYWFGLENIHALTSIPNFELKVVLSDFENVTKHAIYASFHLGNAATNYRLTVYGYSGTAELTAGDALTYHDGMMFSTYDSDHDITTQHCAVVYHGAWWYARCHNSNLNGKYLFGHHDSYADGIEWIQWHQDHYSLKTTLMMIRKT